MPNFCGLVRKAELYGIESFKLRGRSQTTLTRLTPYVKKLNFMGRIFLVIHATEIMFKHKYLVET